MGVGAFIAPAPDFLGFAAAMNAQTSVSGSRISSASSRSARS